MTNQRINVMLDQETIDMLDDISDVNGLNNRSAAIRYAVRRVHKTDIDEAYEKRRTAPMLSTITDAYNYYLDGLGDTAEHEPRTLEDLRDYIHDHDKRYDELDDEFWGELFESGWGYNLDS